MVTNTSLACHLYIVLNQKMELSVSKIENNMNRFNKYYISL